MMETIKHFLDFLIKIGAHHFLAVGIVVIIIWLIISGLRKGLKKKDQEKGPNKNGENKNDLSD